jgi:hypothetical protein
VLLITFSMQNEFVKLSDLMPGSATKFKMAGTLRNTMLMHVFKTIANDVLPPKIAKYVRAKYIKQGVLWVAVPHSIAMQEMSYKVHIIVKLINERFQGEEVKNIRTVIES